MLYLHQFHQVVGKRAKAFESAYREGWMPRLAEGSDARLAWYFDLAHGSGLAYRVITVTAVVTIAPVASRRQACARPSTSVRWDADRPPRAFPTKTTTD